MNTNTVDAKMLGRMFLAGAKNLEAKKEWINELNVFPVPDGDTGTNMTLTILSAASEVSALENPTMKTLANYRREPDKLPPEFQDIRMEEGVERAVCDYIAGMTDVYAVECFNAAFIPKSWSVK